MTSAPKINTGLLVVSVLFSANLFAGPIKVPDCGGRGQRPCHPLDSEFYFNAGSGAACDRGLKVDLNNFFKTSDDQCVNETRETGGKDYSWVGWALGQQRYGIAANEPINWITTLNAHNAYNNLSDGYLIPDQKYSITDLLNWGVRSLELDVHWAYGQVMLCHGFNNHAGCASWDRLYAYAIREIADWLDANPGEVVHIDFEDNANNAPDDAISKPLQKFLGSKVFQTRVASSNSAYPYGTYTFGANTFTRMWPTMTEFRDAGKQVIITSKNTHNTRYIWPSTELGFGDRSSNADIDQCRSGDKKWGQRDRAAGEDPNYWSRIYEGRAVGDLEPLLYEPEVTQATKCAVGIISLGYLNALGSPQVNAFIRKGPDTRREAMIWSWAPNEGYNKGNIALMRHTDGRWLAKPNGNGEKHHFACFVPRESYPTNPGIVFDPTLYTDPKGEHWYITKTADVWQNGANTCRIETNNSMVFGAPRDARMNDKLLALVKSSYPSEDIWLNYSMRPVPLPAVLPATVTFNAAAGQMVGPPPQELRIYSLLNNRYNLTIKTDSQDGNWLRASQTTGYFGEHGATVTLSVDMSVASRLEFGPHTASVTVTDSTLGLTNTVAVSLRIKIPTQLSLISKDWPADGRRNDVLTLQAKLNYTPVTDPGHGGSVNATGMVVFRELVETTVTTTPLDPNSGQPGAPKTAIMVDAQDVGTRIVNYNGDDPEQNSNPTNTVTLKLTNLTPGKHRYAAFYVGSYEGDNGYTGDSSYGPSASDPVEVYVFRDSGMFIDTNSSTVKLGEPLIMTFHAYGTGEGDPLPTGQVKLEMSNMDVSGPSTPVGTYTLDHGLLNVTLSDLKVGRYEIIGFYLGDAQFARSTTSTQVTVVRGNPVSATITMSPAGSTFMLDNVAYTSPKTFTWQVGSQHKLAPGSSWQTAPGERYTFARWSDSSQPVRFIQIQQQNYSITGTYQKEYLLTLTHTGNGAVAVSPSAYQSYYAAGTQVQFTAAPASGSVFMNWAGDANGSTQPLVVTMDKPLKVSAVFAPAQNVPPALGAVVRTKSGTNAAARVWTLVVTNAGKGPATGTKLTGVTFAQTAGAACTPALASALPLSIGTIAAGTSANANVTLDFSSCAATARFTVTFNLAADGGYTTSAAIANQYR